MNALVTLNFHFLLQTEYIPLLHHVSKIVEDHIAVRQKLHANSTTAESWYVKETSDLDQGVRDAKIPDDIQRRIYIDPGGTTTAACVLEGDCKSDPRIVNCGKAEYRHMASMDRLQQKREKLRKASGLEDVMTNLPTPRGSSVRSMLDHLEALFVHLEEILEHYGTRYQRSRAWCWLD